MANITYANKDKTAALGTAPRTWRDEDANEVKNVVNNFRASLVDGKVPKVELPDVAIKIGSADDFDGAGIADGYLIYWDQTAGKFKVKAGPGGIGDVDIDGNTDVFLFDKTNVGGDITLLIGLNDQLAKTVLAGPESVAGTPSFRRLKVSDIEGLEEFLIAPDAVIQRGTLTNAGNDVNINGTVTSWIWRVGSNIYENSTSQIFSITPPTTGNFRYDIITGDNTGAYNLVSGTAAASSDAAVIPSVPANQVGLGIIFSNDTGVTELSNFALSTFVRFDISNQGLIPSQRQNARTNIQAVSKDTDDSRTGGLTNDGDLTVNGNIDQNIEANEKITITRTGTGSPNIFEFYESQVSPTIPRLAIGNRGEFYNKASVPSIFDTSIRQEVRSQSSNRLTRRDELYLTYPVTIGGTGKLNDVALSNGVGEIKFGSDVTEVSGIDANGDAKELLIWSDNPDGITLSAEDVLSIAANRFHREVNIPYQTWVKVVYDGDLARWVNGNTGELQETDARYFEVVDDVLTLKYILPDIAALQAFVRGPAVIAYVSDPVRGGYFNYVTEANFSGSADFGTSFPAQDGGYWVRRYSGAILADWFGAVGDGVTDDILALEACRDAIPESGEMSLTGDKIYAVSRTFEWFKPAGSGGGQGYLTLSSIGGTATLRGISGSGIDIVIDIQGSTTTGRSFWFSSFRDIKFINPNECQSVVRIGGGNTWWATFERCWFASGPTSQQLVSITNDNVSATLDYFHRFDKCVFRGANHNLVIGGEFINDILVPCKSPTNRIKITDTDFDGYANYGIYMSNPETGGGTDGHTFKGIHFNGAQSGAIADIRWQSTQHYVEAFFESGAQMFVDFASKGVGGHLVCSGIGVLEYDGRFGLNGVPYTGNIPLPERFESLHISTLSPLGSILTSNRVMTSNLYSFDDRDISISPLVGRKTNFNIYDKDTNTYENIASIDGAGMYSFKTTGGLASDGFVDFNRTFGLVNNQDTEIYKFVIKQRSSTSTNMVRIGYFTVFGTAGISSETVSLQENGSTETTTISRPSENVIRFSWTGFRGIEVRLTREQ